MSRVFLPWFLINNKNYRAFVYFVLTHETDLQWRIYIVWKCRSNSQRENIIETNRVKLTKREKREPKGLRSDMKSRESTRKVWVYESLRREGKIRDPTNYPTAISYLFHLRAVYNESSIIFIVLRPPPPELFERYGKHCSELEDEETNTHISIFFLSEKYL